MAEQSKTQKLLKDIEADFFYQLEAKTGWGRNEIKEAYRIAVNNALIKNVFPDGK